MDTTPEPSSPVEEFVKRAAFALVAGIAVHDKPRADKDFLQALIFIERAAGDSRNFVKKGAAGRSAPSATAISGCTPRRCRRHDALRRLPFLRPVGLERMPCAI